MTGLSPTRRALLIGAGAATLTLAGGRAAFAQGVGSRKLVVVILRGGLDGLAAVAPVSDPRYVALRGNLALTAGTGFDLGDGMMLHPRLETLSALYAEGKAAILHAAASPYRERSHFDGQDVLESGAVQVYGARDGWLNRALQRAPSASEAVGVGAAVPLLLRGAAPATSWAPNVLPETDADTLSRLMDLYAGDALLGPALASAVEVDAMASGMDMGGRMPAQGPNSYEPLARAAGRLMAAENGAGVTVISFDGWDTHANQGAEEGALANRLAGLDRAIAGLREELGGHWTQTAVIMATEFGRTVTVNGTRGTDHGSGGAAFLFGGAVRGGRILGDWPGLARLHENRDLIPANDLRSLFKGVLRDHWGANRSDLDGFVFPDSTDARPLEGLIA